MDDLAVWHQWSFQMVGPGEVGHNPALDSGGSGRAGPYLTDIALISVERLVERGNIEPLDGGQSGQQFRP